jgi:hypothetical protein
MLIRNDDVAADTDARELKKFCKLCDKYGHDVVHAITPLGVCLPVHVNMDNGRLRSLGSGEVVWDNDLLMDFLYHRPDRIAVHGLWHTHEPHENEIQIARKLLERIGFEPMYYVPPFNEGTYPEVVAGLKLMQHIDRIEDYLARGTPKSEVVYCHSWRFGTVEAVVQGRKWHALSKLEAVFKRCQETKS